MRIVPLWAGVLVTMLLVAACADAPTAPLDGEITATAAERPSTNHILNPVIVIGTPRCDPYLDLNWCQGDGSGGGTCMTSLPGGVIEAEYTVSTCPGAGGYGGPGGGKPGGGGGGTSPDPTKEDCDPQFDPDCNQPLTPDDLASLAIAFARHLRPASEFTDPGKAEQCRQLKAEFDRLSAAGAVFRGAYDTPENDPHTGMHVGVWDPVGKTMHFEPSALDAANAGDPAKIRDLVNTALHESAHALNLNHTAPFISAGIDMYAEAPFDLLSPGTNSCIKGW